MKKSKIFIRLLAILCVLSITGCSLPKTAKQAGELVEVTKTEQYFGTIITITLYGDNEKELEQMLQESFLTCGKLENICSATLPDSELSKVNQQAYSKPVPVSEELFSVLKKAMYYYELSDGSFDVSIGRLTKLWGIGTEKERIPEETELEELKNRHGGEHIVLNEKDSTVQYTDEQLQIDLGAIAKGYASDVVKEYLSRQKNLKGALLNFGGNIMTIGENKEGGNWKIGITDPLHPQNVCCAVSVKDRCVITSGNYERYFIKDGVRYHHILDPFTGRPAESGVISTTIIGTDGAACDALSTACYVMGLDRAMKLIEGLDGMECVLIDEKGAIHCSSGMEAYGFYEVE